MHLRGNSTRRARWLLTQLTCCGRQIIPSSRYWRNDLWVRRGSPLWDDWRDWHEAERLANELSESRTDRMNACIKWRAMHLWHLSGRPAGRELDFWLQAEKEVRDQAPYFVRVIAYEHWENRGHPLWDAQTDWSEAERQVLVGV